MAQYARSSNGSVIRILLEGLEDLKQCEVQNDTILREVSCTTPSGAGADKDVVVTVGNQTSEPQTLWSYGGMLRYPCIYFGMKIGTTFSPLFTGPAVAYVDPETGPTAGDVTITINGANFGNDSSVTIEVTIDGNECTDPEWVSGTQITCTLPEGTGKDKEVVVTVDDQESEANATFSYDGML